MLENIIGELNDMGDNIGLRETPLVQGYEISRLKGIKAFGADLGVFAYLLMHLDGCSSVIVKIDFSPR